MVFVTRTCTRESNGSALTLTLQGLALNLAPADQWKKHRKRKQPSLAHRHPHTHTSTSAHTSSTHLSGPDCAATAETLPEGAHGGSDSARTGTGGGDVVEGGEVELTADVCCCFLCNFSLSSGEPPSLATGALESGEETTARGTQITAGALGVLWS